MDDELSDSAKVGYRNPPKETRFKKGVSGNPKGRPKGTKNLLNIVLKEGRKPVHVNGPKGKRTVTKIEAAVLQLGNKAAQGDLRSSRDFFSLYRLAEDSVNPGAPLMSREIDQPVMKNIVQRIRRSSKEVTLTSDEIREQKS